MSHGHFGGLTSQKMGLATQDDLHLAVCLTHSMRYKLCWINKGPWDLVNKAQHDSDIHRCYHRYPTLQDRVSMVLLTEKISSKVYVYSLRTPH